MDIVMQQKAARAFAEAWAGRGDEKQDMQQFWTDMVRDVFGVANPSQYIEFEKPLAKGFVDAYIPKTRVLIEQKGINIDLDAKEPRQNRKVTPYEQARDYMGQLGLEEKPRFIITSNFKKIRIYNTKIAPRYDRKTDTWSSKYEEIDLADFGRDYWRLNFLVSEVSEAAKKEMELSIKAGDLVGLLYDAFAARYNNIENESSQQSLNKLCVRLVFCLYAEDAGIFGQRNMFHDYLEKYDAQGMRRALTDLFKVLDQDPEKGERDPYLKEDNPTLAAFPYVNGGLFEDESIEIPPFTEEIRDLLLNKASADFDWSEISPTIFGAVFESTLNPQTRRAGGMHYTSIENIHKVIDPLFLDGLKLELDAALSEPVARTRRAKLAAFQDKLASLKFLDPAAGSGNFLTETYLSLRRLENEAVRALTGGQMVFGEAIDPIKVDISQFCGIEINDFAVTVAKTALWIAESQMMIETQQLVTQKLDFLPLKTNANIHEGNALRMDWNEVVPAGEVDYIMGNPPFVGARLMGKSQKADVEYIFNGVKNAGNMDYVGCWYKKAADFLAGTKARAALVSTNSITQGEQVSILWGGLLKKGLKIQFAYRTFRWDSEANAKAHVHCVIVGFGYGDTAEKTIYDGDGPRKASNINPYLIDAPDILISSRSKPVCKVPEIGIGNKPIDGGYYLFTKEEMEEFIKKEPQAKEYFHPWYGSKEFINRCPRYCLYLGDCAPDKLRRMPECLKRVEAVRKYREESTSAGTRKLAETPTRFHVTNMPQGSYIVIPKVSSERRRYVPMGFFNPDTLCSDLVFLIPDATLYHFGVLTSNVHMSWMRAVCGRLEMRYRYSKDIVYNNFPWPNPSPALKARIEETAKAILAARALYPDSSLADLYDPNTMPAELLRAHRANDAAVMAAYGWKKGTDAYTDESACVAELMKLYQKLTSG